MNEVKASAADALSEEELAAIERNAVELADLAGAEIKASLGRSFSMHYKTGSAETEWRDPVSEVDDRVEQLIRLRLGERFPGHDIIGEESEERPGRDHDIVWAVDPVDGTANFVNGYPMFAAAIGVLYRGRPVVGALWCSASHLLRAGVYHARLGSGLAFDGEPVAVAPNPGVRKRLAGVPWFEPADAAWDARKTGSAAIECAFVAAGLLEVARFNSPNIWDIAGGLCLVTAAGRDIRFDAGAGWQPFERFEARAKTPEGAPDLRHWAGRVVIGDAAAVERMLAGLRPAER